MPEPRTLEEKITEWEERLSRAKKDIELAPVVLAELKSLKASKPVAHPPVAKEEKKKDEPDATWHATLEGALRAAGVEGIRSPDFAGEHGLSEKMVGGRLRRLAKKGFVERFGPSPRYSRWRWKVS